MGYSQAVVNYFHVIERENYTGGKESYHDQRIVEEMEIDPSIALSRLLIYRLAFQTLSQQASIIATVNVVSDIEVASDFYLLEEKEFRFSIIKNVNRWKCSCYFQEKTGVPCKHILKVMIMLRESVFNQIDNYWKIQTPTKGEEVME